MPLVEDGSHREPRKRRTAGRGLWLLLIPPLMLVALVSVAAFHPLELQAGPFWLQVGRSSDELYRRLYLHHVSHEYGGMWDAALPVPGGNSMVLTCYRGWPNGRRTE